MIGLKKIKVDNEKLDMHGYRAQVYNHGTLPLESVVKMMGLESTVTRADILAVLSALRDVVMQDLANGYNVALGDLGTVQLKVKSKGAEHAKDWGTDMISGTRVRLVPSTTLKKTIRLGATGINLRMA